jgi:FKBP-type peptidyl-prolyl cis-trans isomerase
MKNNLKAGILFAAVAPFFLSSCDRGIQTNPNGLKYQILHDEDGTPAKYGDFITMHLIMSTEKDSVLKSTFKEGVPITAKLYKPGMKGGIEEGLVMLSAGDSAVFFLSIDTLMKGQPAESRPRYFPPGSMVKYTIKMLKVVDSASAQSEQMKSIMDYGKNKGLSLQKTASGLHYAITAPGSGAKANPGDTIEVHYVGTLLDGGKEFDNSRSRNQPFTFPVGMGMVIPGWDEGLQLLPVGAKAILVIPSNLAYGDRGAPGSPIGPNAALVFDVEVLKIKPARTTK